ncbi:MAG: hypothetical protein ACK5NG_01765 [Chthoniobacterales bacterium]
MKLLVTTFAVLTLSFAGVTYAESEATVAPYALDVCLVSDEEFDDEPFVLVYEGQEIKLCCKKCSKKFKSDPDKYLKKLKEASADKAADKE